MSAVLSGIGPVSVRYAAQIRDLLYAQAVKRMVADEEAARAEAAAERAARLEATRSRDVEEPVKVDIETPPPAPLAEPVRQPDAKEAEPAQATAQIVDIQA